MKKIFNDNNFKKNKLRKYFILGYDNPMQYYLDIAMSNRTFNIRNYLKQKIEHNWILKLNDDLVLLYNFKAGDTLLMKEKNGKLISWTLKKGGNQK